LNKSTASKEEEYLYRLILLIVAGVERVEKNREKEKAVPEKIENREVNKEPP